MLFLQIIRIIFGSIYVLFLPGFLFTFVFFERKEIDHLERIVLSLALSLATVPLLVFLFNLIKVPINALNVFLEILLLIILAADVLLLKRSKRLMGFFKKIRSKLP
ncbi:MAG: hypothetical protein A2458_05525 [Candidatus Kerfeldbacteria bacterium RIFOXYC2_FULL_38_9]|nr:MAG: hypothetical protein A2458_05525 [Candidatus Kerfeldbacteria bacterium RIFOXYC2_FULL_38_9]